jgi:hypothetical protein
MGGGGGSLITAFLQIKETCYENTKILFLGEQPIIRGFSLFAGVLESNPRQKRREGCTLISPPPPS